MFAHVIVGSFADIAAQRVSFHARLSRDLNDHPGTLKPFTIITNEGNAFSGPEGLFTAPVSGTYFFVASVSKGATGMYADMMLKKDGESVSRAYASQLYSGGYTQGACHAVLHLTAGQRVWLESGRESSYYYWRGTSFTGFLLTADDRIDQKLEREAGHRDTFGFPFGKYE